MAGNREGGKKAYATVMARDPDFYKRIGAKGAANRDPNHPTGFALNRERARLAGSKGGSISKRRPKVVLE